MNLPENVLCMLFYFFILHSGLEEEQVSMEKDRVDEAICRDPESTFNSFQGLLEVHLTLKCDAFIFLYYKYNINTNIMFINCD